MTEQTQVAAAKTSIRPNVEKMVKSASGGYHKDDVVGNALAGLVLPQVKEVATALGLDPAKYEHLNNGQQRMTLGNQIRKITSEVGDHQDILLVKTGEFKAINAEAAEAAAAEKEAAKQAKADAKALKDASKSVKATPAGRATRAEPDSDGVVDEAAAEGDASASAEV